MTVNIDEAWDSGEISRDNAKFNVICWDVADAVTAFNEVLNAVPSTFHNGIKSLILINTGSTRRIGEFKWRVGPIEYGTEQQAAQDEQQNQNEEAEFGWDFEIGGGTAHITQSLATVDTYSATPGGTPPDFKGAINVTKDSVEGADIPARSFTYSRTKSFLQSSVTQSFQVGIYNLSVCVNSQPFENWQPGEVLFLGASGSAKGLGLAVINFKFQVIPNGTFTVGSIAGISKKGHHLLWIRYADEEDTTAKALVKRPTAAYVEQVLEEDDLNNLPLG